MWARDTKPSGKSVAALDTAARRATDDFFELGPSAFKEKYGMSWTKYSKQIDSARNAIHAEDIRYINNDKPNRTSQMYDSFEKRDSAKYNKGGSVRKPVNAGASVPAHKGKRK